MNRRVRAFIPMLLLVCAACSALAQERGVWRKELESFEKAQARVLLPVQGILFSELISRQQVAAKGRDLQLRAEMEARVALAKEENDLLKQGRISHPSRESDYKSAFVRAGSGRQWTLSGTKWVPRVGLCRGGIRSFSKDGHELGDLAVSHLAPGVFGGKRRQEPGWNCFIFSADLRSAQCLIVSEVLEGVCLSRGIAEPTRDSKSEAMTGAEMEDQTDLLTLLEARHRQKMLEHEATRRSLIESFIRASTTPADDLPELRRLLRQVTDAHELVSRPAKVPELKMETPTDFLTRIRGSEWQISSVPSLSRVRFEGDFASVLTPTGQVQEKLSIKLEWPGVLYLKPIGSEPILLAFGPDHDRVLGLRVRSVFPGRLVD